MTRTATAVTANVTPEIAATTATPAAIRTLRRAGWRRPPRGTGRAGWSGWARWAGWAGWAGWSGWAHPVGQGQGGPHRGGPFSSRRRVGGQTECIPGRPPGRGPGRESVQVAASSLLASGRLVVDEGGKLLVVEV